MLDGKGFHAQRPDPEPFKGRYDFALSNDAICEKRMGLSCGIDGTRGTVGKAPGMVRVRVRDQYLGRTILRESMQPVGAAIDQNPLFPASDEERAMPAMAAG